MLVPLVLLSGLLVGGQRDAVQAVAGGTLIALPTIAVARYVLYAARPRRGKQTTAGVRVIVFGAGDAGIALINRLLAEPDAAYRPVALLDDDPDKRRLRVHGIAVRGDRTRMAEVAAATGATVLVIAIAKASGTVIRDLTARAEQCGLVPEVVPTTTELISGGARIEGVRDPRISDLLGRRPVRTDVAAIAGHFAGKRILVTGARALLDSDETLLADIRDRRSVREVFEQFRPRTPRRSSRRRTRRWSAWCSTRPTRSGTTATAAAISPSSGRRRPRRMPMTLSSMRTTESNHLC
jgi:hypothetical protein